MNSRSIQLAFYAHERRLRAIEATLTDFKPVEKDILAVPVIRDPRPSGLKSFTPEDIERMIKAAVASALASYVPPAKGPDTKAPPVPFKGSDPAAK